MVAASSDVADSPVIGQCRRKLPFVHGIRLRLLSAPISVIQRRRPRFHMLSLARQKQGTGMISLRVSRRTDALTIYPPSTTRAVPNKVFLEAAQDAITKSKERHD